MREKNKQKILNKIFKINFTKKYSEREKIDEHRTIYKERGVRGRNIKKKRIKTCMR